MNKQIYVFQCYGGSQRGVSAGGQGNLMYKTRKAYKRTVFNFVLLYILTCIEEKDLE